MVADDDPLGRHALAGQQGQLLHRQLAVVRGVGRDRRPGRDAGQGRRAEDALLGRGDVVALGAELADHARADARVADAGLELADEDVGQGARRGLEHDAAGRPSRDTSRCP